MLAWKPDLHEPDGWGRAWVGERDWCAAGIYAAHSGLADGRLKFVILREDIYLEVGGRMLVFSRRRV